MASRQSDLVYDLIWSVTAAASLTKTHSWCSLCFLSPLHSNACPFSWVSFVDQSLGALRPASRSAHPPTRDEPFAPVLFWPARADRLIMCSSMSVSCSLRRLICIVLAHPLSKVSSLVFSSSNQASEPISLSVGGSRECELARSRRPALSRETKY